MCNAGVAEEEDFVGHTFQLPLVEQVEDQEQASEAHPVAVGGGEALGAIGLLSESEQSTHALRALRLAEEWMQARRDSIRPENEAPKVCIPQEGQVYTNCAFMYRLIIPTQWVGSHVK